MIQALFKVKARYFSQLQCILRYCGVVSAVKGAGNITFIRESQHNCLTREQSNFFKLFLPKTRKRLVDQQD